MQREQRAYLHGLLDRPLWADWIVYFSAVGVPAAVSILATGRDPSTNEPIDGIAAMVGNVAAVLVVGFLLALAVAFGRLRWRASGRPLRWFPRLLLDLYTLGLSRIVRRYRAAPGRSPGLAEPAIASNALAADPVPDAATLPRSRIFVVHGRSARRHEVARFLRATTGNEPVILDEQPNASLTVIEKFERYAHECTYAVVLVTGDDEGRLRGTTKFGTRARQNVLFELGYFVGVLGRGHVAVLSEPNVDVPSDLGGVLTTSFDETGGWKFALVKELRHVGIAADLNRAV